MRCHTIILLLLLGETFAAAAAAVEISSSRSSHYTSSGLFVQPGKSSSKSRCWSSWSTAQLVQMISLPRASATSDYEKFFAGAFSRSLCTPGAEYTCLSEVQLQQQPQAFHAGICSTFLTRFLAVASAQQHRHRSPFFTSCTSSEVAVTDVSLPRCSSLRLLPQEKRLQGQFLLLLSCPALLQQNAAVAAPYAYIRGTVRATAAATVTTSRFSSSPVATSNPEASLTESISRKREERTALQSGDYTRRSITAVGRGGGTGFANTGSSGWKRSNARNMALRKVYKTKYGRRHPPVVRQRFKQQGHDSSRAIASSAPPPLPFAALASPGRVDVLGSGRHQTLRDYLSFVCTARLGGVTSERYTSSDMCRASKALLSASSRGVCGRNRVCCAFLGNAVSLAGQCSRVSSGSPTACCVARGSSRNFNHKGCRNRSSSGTRLFLGGSNAGSSCCSSESSGSVGSYVCLTSPEAARVFSTCWQRAGCPALLPGMLVCVGEGTRAAAEKALLLNFHLYVRKQQPPRKYHGLHQLLQTHEEHQDDQHKPPHVLSKGNGEEVDEAQYHSCRKGNALLPSPLTHRECSASDFAGHPILLTSCLVSASPVSAGAAADACSPAPVRLSDHASRAQPVSSAVSVNGEMRSPTQAVVPDARPAVDENHTRGNAAEVDTRPAKDTAANDAHADPDWLAAGSVEQTAVFSGQCGHNATIAARADAHEEVNDSVALSLRQSFLPFRPSSSCAASLAAELPPRPPLLQYLHTAVCVLLSQQQLPRTKKKFFHKPDEIHRVVECINTAIICRNEHTHPGCTYTPEEAVGCAVKLLHQEEGRELKSILLQRCCPCWLQTRVLWPASALARPTFQDVLQQRPLQHLQQYSFAAVPSAVRLHFDVLPLQQVAEKYVNKDEATRKQGEVGAREALKPAAVPPSVATMTERPLVQRRYYTAASTVSTKASSAAADEVTPRSSAGPPPAEFTEVPAANRLFVVDRYNTYTTTQVMLTAAERYAVLQCMQEVLCWSKGHNNTESSCHTPSKQNRSDIGSTTSNSGTLNNIEDSKRTSGTLGRSSRSVETTNRGLESDMPRDLATSVCSTHSILVNASGADSNTGSPVSSSPEDTDVTYAGDLSDNSSVDVGGSGDREGSRQSNQDTAEAGGALKEALTCEGLVIVILASPSAVWGWTSNGLPVSAAACCAERPLPSYTAVHASADGESRFYQRSRSRMLLQEPSSIDVGNDETSCSEVGGSRAVRPKKSNSPVNARGTNCSKNVTVAPDTNILGRSSSGNVEDDNVSNDASTSGRERMSDRKNSKPADLRVVGESIHGKRRRKGRDAAILEAEEFVRLLQTCQQVIQEGRRQREQEQQDRKRRRLVALCVGPTTASAAKQAGFCETLTGEHASVAALADLVKACVLECCSRCCDASEERCSSGHDRVKSSDNGEEQTKNSNTGDHGGSSCSLSKSNGRILQRLWRENKTTAAREDEWSCSGIHSGGNDTADGSSSGRHEAETGTGKSKRHSAKKQNTSAREAQPGPVCEKKMRVLILLTRAEGRNHALVQELLEKKELLIQAVGLKHLVSKNEQHPSLQRLIKVHQRFHAPDMQKNMQSRSETPVGVLEVPLLQTQIAQGIFKREQRRLIAALLQLPTVQGAR